MRLFSGYHYYYGAYLSALLVGMNHFSPFIQVASFEITTRASRPLSATRLHQEDYQNYTQPPAGWFIFTLILIIFTNYFRFYLVSLDEPSERKCSHLVGIKGITEEELIAVGIMGYDSEKYNKKKCLINAPEYRGSDREIEDFLRAGGNNK